ncbi:hypothetical protein [Nocardioides sp. CFH 31398]|uniref:hypothetical protein n=1 Tax=Nocardioides sp. CFH 31398 TaxID=2919579 RepID=UPI001F05FA50|nr:hypothetical protein [Nocardioides sp. CFH 31398]MCH1867086.1 hypothetical protein [Nocardioides sp. CFH 31398]
MTKHQSKGRPQGNPSRPSQPRPSVADVVSRMVAAESILPGLADQFRTLNPATQALLFRIVDLIGGMSHDEKEETRVQLTGIRRFDHTSEEMVELLGAVESLVANLDRIATPTVDGQPKGTLAEQFLADYAASQEG